MLPTPHPAANHDSPVAKITTRRTFALTAACLGLGIAFGATFGMRVAAERAVDPALRAAQRLATVAPIEDLVADWQQLATTLAFDHPRDHKLWLGVQRLVDWCLHHARRGDGQLVLFLLGMVRHGQPPEELGLQRHEPALHRLHLTVRELL